MTLLSDDDRDRLGEHFSCLADDIKKAIDVHHSKAGLQREDRVRITLAALEAIKATLVLSHGIFRGKDMARELELESAAEYERFRGAL